MGTWTWASVVCFPAKAASRQTELSGLWQMRPTSTCTRATCRATRKLARWFKLWPSQKGKAAKAGRHLGRKVVVKVAPPREAPAIGRRARLEAKVKANLSKESAGPAASQDIQPLNAPSSCQNYRMRDEKKKQSTKMTVLVMTAGGLVVSRASTSTRTILGASACTRRVLTQAHHYHPAPVWHRRAHTRHPRAHHLHSSLL